MVDRVHVERLAAIRAPGPGDGRLGLRLEVVATSPRPVDRLLDLVREAMLHDALLLRRADVASDPRDELRRALVAVRADGALSTALTTRGAWRDEVHRIAGAQLVEIDPPAASEPTRARLRHRPGEVAERLTTPLGWDDLVVSDGVAQRILELLAAIRHQAQVMDDWGFGRKLGPGRAVSALLSGPPGTGKTLVATLVAKELGRELFRVDLARAAATWSAETESRLGLAFDEAHSAQALLLLDDADALFARHTGAALVQRLDAFEGVVLVTAGDRSAITGAFGERLRVHIALTAPTAAERAQLWQAMLPPEAPVAHDIDFAELAQRYEMTGRFIKNAVVRAAYLAAGDQLPGLTSATLHRAAQLECEAMRARR